MSKLAPQIFENKFYKTILFTLYINNIIYFLLKPMYLLYQIIILYQNFKNMLFNINVTQ